MSPPGTQNEKLNGLQSYGANLISIPWVMITNGDVSDDLVYDLTKALVENKPALAESFGLFNGFTPETMAPASVVSYHAGAQRYFDEAGIAHGQ